MVLVMLSVVVFGYCNIDLLVCLLLVVVVVEYLVVLVLDFCILCVGGDYGVNFDFFVLVNVMSGMFFIGLLFVFVVFIGFEVIIIYGEEVKNFKCVILIVIYILVLLIGVFYGILLWVFIIGVGSDKVVKLLEYM